MTWTTTKPMQPGWYWWRLDKTCEPEIVDLKIWGSYKLRDFSCGAITDIPNEGQWAGPITAPEEG